jgi:hypothetical protein
VDLARPLKLNVASSRVCTAGAARHAGNNSDSLSFDQRGLGYSRSSGAEADIGAYEVQQYEIVFNANFEGCP